MMLTVMIVISGSGQCGIHHYWVHRGGLQWIWPVDGDSVSSRSAMLRGYSLPSRLVSALPACPFDVAQI